jgi:hypothetical protein
MLHARSMKLFSGLTAVALVGFLLAVFTAQHGCASNCATNCPATAAYIGSSDDVNLAVAFDVNGPACPPRGTVFCTGDEYNTDCTHTIITGQAASWCDVLVLFDPNADGRPEEVIHLEFGQPYSAPGTCCTGYPVIGPASYIIPDYPKQGGIYATTDGGTRFYDGISYVTDGGADGGDAATDASAPGTDARAGG